MTISIRCPSCNAGYRVPDKMAGRAAKCKKCGHQIEIPLPVTAESDDDDELKLAPAAEPSPPAAGETTGPAADQGQEEEEKCPMCSAALLPDAEMCLSCGFILQGKAEESVSQDFDESEPERLSERAEELLVDTPVSWPARIGGWIARGLLYISVLAVLGAGGWWVYGKYNSIRSNSRIGALVESVVVNKADPRTVAPDLVSDVPNLNSYFDVLADRLAKQSSIDLGGLLFVNSANGYPRFLIKHGVQQIDISSKAVKDVPRAFVDAAGISTLIVNLPTDCDLAPLIKIKDPIGRQAAIKLFNLRMDLDWLIEKSCVQDEEVSQFAALVLLDRLNLDASNATAFDTLKEFMPVEGKRKAFEQLQKELASSTEEQDS